MVQLGGSEGCPPFRRREVVVVDQSRAGETRKIAKADPGNPFHVGAPMPGLTHFCRQSRTTADCCCRRCRLFPVPLAGSRWVVAKFDNHSRFVGQLLPHHAQLARGIERALESPNRPYQLHFLLAGQSFMLHLENNMPHPQGQIAPDPLSARPLFFRDGTVPDGLSLERARTEGGVPEDGSLRRTGGEAGLLPILPALGCPRSGTLPGPELFRVDGGEAGLLRALPTLGCSLF
jgi:hypothetical protein